MKSRDRTTRDYQVELDSEAVRRVRLVRAASAGGAVLALLVIWWMSSPDDAPPEIAPPPLVLQPDEAQSDVVPAEREVARVELPALTPPPVAEGAGDADEARADAPVGVEPEVASDDGAAPDETAADGAQAEAPAPPAADATLPQPSADGRFRVEMPEFVALDEVSQAAGMAAELGVPTSVLRRVVAGPFERRAEAEAARRRAQDSHGLNGMLIGSEARGWRVQLGVFGAEENALAARDKLVADGFQVVIDARLLVGHYSRDDEAETVRRALEEHAGISGMRVLEMQ